VGVTERIQSVDRAIDLLLAVAAAGPTDAGVPALAKVCGLNRATAWRLLKTLQARGLVTVDGGGRYALGVTAVELGGAAGPDALIAKRRPWPCLLSAGSPTSTRSPRRRC
jgi:DNA-binding IclR family transcriptional regulator